MWFIITKKGLHLASCWKQGFLELGNGLYDDEESFSIPFQMKNNMYYHEHFNKFW